MDSSLKATQDEISKLISIFDANKFKDIKASYKPKEVRGLTGHFNYQAAAHPLAIILYNIEAEFEETNNNNVNSYSEESFLFLDTLSRLRRKVKADQFLDILRHIISKQQVWSSLYEGEVFTQYLDIKKMEISVIPELKGDTISVSTKKKTPDFIVKCNDGDVYIECKSLVNLDKLEEDIWNQIQWRITKELRKYKRCWFDVPLDL